MAENDGLPRTEPNNPPPAPERSSATVTCAYCECELTPSGDYIRLSNRAKELRDQGETIDTYKARLAASQADLAEALRERDEARAEVTRLQKEQPADDDGANARGQKLNVRW